MSSSNRKEPDMSTWTIDVISGGTVAPCRVGEHIASEDIAYIVAPLIKTLAITTGIKDAWIDGEVTFVLADGRALILKPRDDIDDDEYDATIDAMGSLVDAYATDNATGAARPAVNPLDAVYAFADKLNTHPDHVNGGASVIGRAFAAELYAILPPRTTN